jgi:3'-phosphoadenosine 5'-phosphosulfate (PAPS) 3'-phosphatase
MNRFPQMLETLLLLKPSLELRQGGSGNKSINLLDQQSDYALNIVKGIKYWDMCGAEALIRARLGVCTDKDKNPIIFDPNTSDFSIPNGMLHSRCPAIYDLCYDRIG